MEQKYIDQAKIILSQLTVEEKAKLCTGKDFWHFHGVERLNVSSVMVTDGPHGLRKQAGDSDHIGLNKSVPATCFPTAVTLASTWDTELIYKVGHALAEECLQEDVSVILGPGANIKRSPLCGRNFEYFSEDPYVTGELAAAFINGVQSIGIGTSLKHFAANNQEYNRMTIDTFVDERTLREIYLAGFERAVKKSQPKTVMCSYNQVNGTFASENKYLLTDILCDEWGFKGLTMTDWGASNDRIKGIEAGLDVEMPGPKQENIAWIVESIEQGTLTMEALDKSALRVLQLSLNYDAIKKKDFVYNREQHHALARKASSEGTVLLKNKDTVLPLSKEETIIVIGEFAEIPRYQGSGSSLINPSHLVTVLEGHPQPEKVKYAKGYDVRCGETKPVLLEEAVKLATSADKVIILAGLTDLYESEGFDRTHMQMPKSHTELIEAITKVNNQVIVVLSNGSPVEMPWIKEVSAVVETYLSGQAQGDALWDVLYGQVNPSGKLAETFTVNYKDTMISELFPMGPKGVEYREGLYVGYRYYDKVNQAVQFPFGFGLSYTSFQYDGLKVEKTSGETQSGSISKDLFKVTFTVKNVGQVKGQEIAQIYVKDVESTQYRPEKELKGFAKVALEAGEEKEVSIYLDERAFSAYDVHHKDWLIEAGKYQILVGASSQDIRLSDEVFVEGHVYSKEEADNIAKVQKVYANINQATRFARDTFENLYGKKIIHPTIGKVGTYHENSTLDELKECEIGKLFHDLFLNQSQGILSDDDDEKTKNMFVVMLREMPLRSINMFMGGKISKELLSNMIKAANGLVIEGISQDIESIFKN